MKLANVIAAAVVVSPVLAGATPSSINPADMFDEIQRARAEENANLQATANAVGNGLNWLSLGIGLVRTAHELNDSYSALTPFDANCMDLSPTGAPAVPASCAGNQSACGKCYDDAIHDLNGMRLNLERLRCYYSAYKRFVDASIAFGDSASGIHAVTGLEWQNERAGIVAEFDNLKHAYDEKLQQMLPNLRSALGKVADCEREFFHEPDWYERFGFLYYSFMADRYKRSD